MKEIALVGPVNRVQAAVLGKLLERGLSVNALVDLPQNVMIEDSRLTITPYLVSDHDRVKEAFEGYHDVVLAYNDDLTDKVTNEQTLKYFTDTVRAAREAGVARVIVVGSPDSSAFFVSDLRRLDDIDWVFISTEGDFAGRTADEIITPSHHREENPA